MTDQTDPQRPRIRPVRLVVDDTGRITPQGVLRALWGEYQSWRGVHEALGLGDRYSHASLFEIGSGRREAPLWLWEYMGIEYEPDRHRVCLECSSKENAEALRAILSVFGSRLEIGDYLAEGALQIRRTSYYVRERRASGPG